MTNCHVKLQSKFILVFWLFILHLSTILATDESNCYLPDNVRSKRGSPEDEVLFIESPNSNVDGKMSQEVGSRRRLGRSTDLNLEKNPARSQSDAEINDDPEQEDDDTDDKGPLSHSVSDRNARRYGKTRSGPKVWDHWGKWTSCSVSCGVGKMTRWRHCVSGSCAAGEKEAQIKTCTLASC